MAFSRLQLTRNAFSVNEVFFAEYARTWQVEEARSRRRTRRWRERDTSSFKRPVFLHDLRLPRCKLDLSLDRQELQKRRALTLSVCDGQQKSKNGLFKVRVPRGLARKRKTHVGEADASNLSSDESFEVGKEHMRRAMMPYVGKETVRRSSFDDDSTTDEELDGRGDDAKYGRSQGGQRSRRNSGLSV